MDVCDLTKLKRIQGLEALVGGIPSASHCQEERAITSMGKAG
jgi:hypothetical protein